MTMAERAEEQKQEQLYAEIVAKAADALAEHFPSVQIFVHRERNGGTPSHNQQTCISAGRGDWYARYGQIQEWMLEIRAGIESKHYEP